MPVFCAICCDDSTAWEPVSFADMFSSKLFVNGDQWIHVNIARGEPLPDMNNISGIVLTGSKFNVRDQLPWFGELRSVIREAAEDGRLLVYGGCFGCQLVCDTLGGVVGFNPDNRFVLKNELITVDDTVLSSAGCNCGGLNDFQLIESHGDCILKLPASATLLATSPSCRYEMFIAGSKNNILCCQAHPEFDLQYCILDRILPSLWTSGRLTDVEKEMALESFRSFKLEDSNRMLQIISNFLHQ